MPCRRSTGLSAQAAPITLRFSSTGVAAGRAKRFQVFRMPEENATIDMKPM